MFQFLKDLLPSDKKMCPQCENVTLNEINDMSTSYKKAYKCPHCKKLFSVDTALATATKAAPLVTATAVAITFLERHIDDILDNI